MPFGNARLVAISDWVRHDLILFHAIIPKLVLRDSKQFQLMWVKVFSVDLFHVVFSKRECVLMDCCAYFADEDAVVDNEVRSFVLGAVDAECVELVALNVLF